MLEKYFLKPETLDRIRNCWLGEPIENYVVHLTEQGFSPKTVCRRVPVLTRFAGFAHDAGVDSFEELPGLIEGFVEDWVRTRRRKGRTKEAKRHIANMARVPVQQMLTLLLPDYERPGAAPPTMPFADTAPGFFDFLRRERGLQPTSLALYRSNLRRLERFLQRIGLHDIAALCPAVLSAFTIETGRCLCKAAVGAACGHVRVFLRYLYREGVIARDLSTSVDSPRHYRLSRVPRSISWDEVKRLLESVERRSALGKRDYAILLLLVTYGLRASEVAALTLDSIDWQRDRLIVPDRKAGHNTAFPLSSTVGEAIVDYLRHARPESAERALFLCMRPPFRPIGFAVVSARAGRHLRNAGISVPRPGSHTLRHACVQRLVDARFPLKTIGDYIGHGTPKSTEVYSKIDLEALRDVALGDGEAVL